MLLRLAAKLRAVASAPTSQRPKRIYLASTRGKTLSRYRASRRRGGAQGGLAPPGASLAFFGSLTFRRTAQLRTARSTPPSPRAQKGSISLRLAAELRSSGEERSFVSAPGPRAYGPLLAPAASLAYFRSLNWIKRGRVSARLRRTSRPRARGRASARMRSTSRPQAFSARGVAPNRSGGRRLGDYHQQTTPTARPARAQPATASGAIRRCRF